MPGNHGETAPTVYGVRREIANFKTWAYTYGLDVAALDVLRTSGDREGLRAELKRLQANYLPRRARLGSTPVVRWKISPRPPIGYDDVISEIDKELNATKINTTNYYGDCISRLKASFASLPGKIDSSQREEG